MNKVHINIILLVICAILQRTAYCEPTIDAPNTIKTGELAVLTIKDVPENAKTAWTIVPPTKNFKTFEKGSVAVLTAPSPTSYTLIVACSSPDSLALLSHSITVEGIAPNPPTPTPIPPTPTPNPPNPNSLANQVKFWYTKVTSPTKKEDATKLSTSFSTVGSMIASGFLKTPDEITKLTVESNRAAVGQNAQFWIPFFTDLANYLNVLSKNGTLKTPQDHSKLWFEIAEALKGV